MDKNFSRSRHSGGRDRDDYERNNRTEQGTLSEVELFVKNLSYNTSEEELGGFFEKYGSLDSVRILRTDGRSRGIGFVTFKNKEDAQDAMKDGNRAEIDGRKIFLNWATQREGGRNERRRERSRSNDNSSYKRRRDEKIPTPGSVFTAYVGNLSFKTRERAIEEFFGDCGKIADIRIAKSQDGKSKGFCHVDFESQSGFSKALEKNGKDLEGRELKINESKPYVPGDKFERKDREDRGGRRRRKYSDDD